MFLRSTSTAPTIPRARDYWALGLIAITLVGACLRYPALHGDLWMDEIWSFQIAHADDSIHGLILHQTWANNHLLNSLWLRCLTETAPEIWFRLPSFILGTLCIPLATWTLRRWGAGPGPALLGAAFVALSFFQIQFSTEARGYAGAFACALIALGLRFPSGEWERPCERGWVDPVGFGIIQVIGMLWHPGYVLFVVALAMAQAANLAIGGRDAWGPRIAKLLRWQAFPGIALLLYQIVFLSKLRFGAAGYQEPIRPFLEAAAWTTNMAWTRWGGPIALVLLLFGFALGLARSWRGQRELALALLLACFLLPLGMAFLHPPRVTSTPSLLVLFPRYFHLPLGLALLPMAWGIGALRRGRWPAGMALIAILAIGLVLLLPPFYHFGRIGCSQVLEYLAGKQEEPIRVGTNELTRGLMQFGFYERRMGIEDRFHWIAPENWLLTPPEYLISLAAGALPNPIVPPTIRGEERVIKYEMCDVFPYAGASGFNCVVFRRKWFDDTHQQPGHHQP